MSEREQIGTTRGGQPVESVTDPDEVRRAERRAEAATSTGREQIGTTRGGQPIENVTGPADDPRPDTEGRRRIGTTRGDQPIEE